MFSLKAPAYSPVTGRRSVLFLTLGCIFLAALLLADGLLRGPVSWSEPALRAAGLMEACMKETAAFRRSLGIELDPEVDPGLTGIIGMEYTDITTTLGDLGAKQSSLNPRFASLITRWLEECGLKPGDKVALSLTGSFPALDMAALSACAVLELSPVIISSVGSSSYGANIPGFTWLDMEAHLHDAGLLPWKSSYTSLGGIVDTEGGIDGTGYELGREAMLRHGAVALGENGVRTVIADTERRMRLYTQSGMPRAYINVGGGVSALGWVQEAALLDNGLLRSVPRSSSPQRGLIFRMFEAGVPVIHMLNIERLAAAHYLGKAPHLGQEPADPESLKRERVLALLLLLLCWVGAGLLALRRGI